MRNVTRSVLLVFLGTLLGAAFLLPVGAHIGTAGHLWKEHIRPKADARYDQVVVATETTLAETTTATSFEDLPGSSSATITVPSGGTWLVRATFQAESFCIGPNLSGCAIQILIGDAPGEPNSGIDYAFDAPGEAPGADFESHTVTRSRVLGPGTYEVQVQWALVGGATQWGLDDWHLTVETTRAV